MVVSNVTIGSLMLNLALAFCVYAFAQWRAAERKKNKELLSDLDKSESLIEAKEKTNAALMERLRLVDKFHTVEGCKFLKVNVPVEFAASLNQVLERFKKLHNVELDFSNEQYIEMIEALANDLTKENYRLRHGKASNEDVLSAAATVGAYVLRFIAEFKEVPSEKV